MSRVITIASGKGGVGKTTLVANLGIALAELNQRVLLIDADIAMANLSLILGMQTSPITLHEVLLGEAAISDAIYDGPKGIQLIPAGLSLETYRKIDSARLKSIVDSIKENYDFVLIDAPAGIEKNVLSALSASEQVIIITTPDSPSIADALKTKLIAQKIGAKPIGIIVNFVRNERDEIDKEKIMKLMELPSYGSIPFDPEVRKAFLSTKAEPVIIRKPSTPASIAIKNIALKLTGSTEVILQQKESFITRILSKLFKKKQETKTEVK